jgi:hypothetical protein
VGDALGRIEVMELDLAVREDHLQLSAERLPARVHYLILLVTRRTYAP